MTEFEKNHKISEPLLGGAEAPRDFEITKEQIRLAIYFVSVEARPFYMKPGLIFTIFLLVICSTPTT